MDMKAIRSLAEIMKENSLTRVEIVEEGKTIRMEREAPVAAPSFASAGSAPAIPGNRPCDGIGRTALRRGAAGRDGD